MAKNKLSPVPIAGAIFTLIVVCTSGLFYWQQSYQKKVLAQNTRLQSNLTLLSTGDLMLGRSVNFKGWQKKNFAWSLEKMQPWLQQFDVVVTNLETPIIDDCPLTNEGMIFCADAQAAPALAKSGIDIATLANNHTRNYGDNGLAQTVDFLHEASIGAVPSETFLVQKINNQTFGFFAFDAVSNHLDEEKLTALIAEKSKQVDTLIVALHFGSEYRYQPSATQTNLAHALIDAGAKIILGNHSHWLGPIELYDHGVIVYSHGNFVFDQMWSEETRSGMTIAWNFDDKNLTALTVYPIWITDYGLANLAPAEKATQILQKVQQISGDLGAINDGKLIIELPRQ